MRENRTSITNVLEELNVRSISDFEKLFGSEWPIVFSESGLMFVDCVAVAVRSTASSPLNLSNSAMEDYIELRLLVDMPFVPSCDTSPELTYPYTSLFMHVSVWAVGDDYPVAYHIDVTSYLVGAPQGQSETPFETAFLGYSRATTIRGEVEDAFDEWVRMLAVTTAKYKR